MAGSRPRPRASSAETMFLFNVCQFSLFCIAEGKPHGFPDTRDLAHKEFVGGHIAMNIQWPIWLGKQKMFQKYCCFEKICGGDKNIVFQKNICSSFQIQFYVFNVQFSVF